MKLKVSFKSLKGKFCRSACIILILIVSLSLAGCNNSKFNTATTNTATTKIVSLECRVTAEIQQWKSCDESGWEVPEGASVYKEQEEIKTYKTVGPVYDTKYYYTIDRWVHLKYVSLTCGPGPEYIYPYYVCAENERIYNVEYDYQVKLGCDDSHTSHSVDKDTWESLYVGQEISGEKKADGHIQVDWANINTTNE